MFPASWGNNRFLFPDSLIVVLLRDVPWLLLNVVRLMIRVLFGNAASSIAACSHAGTVQGFISRPSRWHVYAKANVPHKVHSQSWKETSEVLYQKPFRGVTLQTPFLYWEVQKTVFGESFERVGLDWVGNPFLNEQDFLYARPLQHFHVLTFHCLTTFFLWLLILMIVCKYCKSNWILSSCSGSFTVVISTEWIPLFI